MIRRVFVSGDSFVVNACLARKGIDDWLVKQKYYCTGSSLEQQDCHHKNNCSLTTRVSTRLLHTTAHVDQKLFLLSLCVSYSFNEVVLAKFRCLYLVRSGDWCSNALHSHWTKTLLWLIVELLTLSQWTQFFDFVMASRCYLVSTCLCIFIDDVCWRRQPVLRIYNFLKHAVIMCPF